MRRPALWTCSYTEAMTVTLELPDDAMRRLRAEAERRGVSVEVVLTEMVSRELPEPTRAKSVPGFVNLGASTSGRRAREAEDLLAEGFGRD